jgi:hypothetical protein
MDSHRSDIILLWAEKDLSSSHEVTGANLVDERGGVLRMVSIFSVEDFAYCETSGSHGGEYEVWSLLGCQHLLDYTKIHPRRP